MSVVGPNHHTSGLPNSNPNAASVNQVSANGGSPNPSPPMRIFVQRDYRLGVAIRFVPEFPPELNGRIDQATYEFTLNQINAYFQDAENFDCNTFCESCLGFITANLVYFCRDTKYEKCLKRLSKFISEQNTRVYLPRGLQITDPVERGLRCIEIVILNDQTRSS
ncbi:unnamed protein product [Allacma fusca]|uniref:Ras modification protein ERF4 n=1 Tax=Allacma fusca TaxID=39272 RepID=A0A8J2PJ96_9HEXA|nr:unnamed protein product [Allacma fusca]